MPYTVSVGADVADATLVADAHGGGRDAFAAIYDRHGDEIHDLCWSMLRHTDEAALGALLVARLHRESCRGLRLLLADWDGAMTPDVRQRVSRHIAPCAECRAQRDRMMSSWSLLTVVPIVFAPADCASGCSTAWRPRLPTTR